VTTTEEIEFIPKEFWAALDKYPDDFTLRCAVADRLEELGEYDYADCMRWSAAKRRVPKAGWYWAGPEDRHAQIPFELRTSGQGRPQLSYLFADCQSATFRRLIWRWSLCTAEQKAAFWKWEPTDADK
jgi:uncharacterized protein (TIGR02996 family)